MDGVRSYTLSDFANEFGNDIYGKFILSYENQNDLHGLQYKLYFTSIRICKTKKSIRFCGTGNNFIQVNNVSEIITYENIVNVYKIIFDNTELNIIGYGMEYNDNLIDYDFE